MEQTWILVGTWSMSQVGNIAWTILSLMIQTLVSPAHQQPYGISMNVDQAVLTKQWTCDYREVKK